MGWQPIETAPKDGTFVLLYGIRSHWQGPRANGPRPRKLGEPSVRQGHWSSGLWQTGDLSRWEAPTHWMPLPEPPSTNPEGED